MDIIFDAIAKNRVDKNGGRAMVFKSMRGDVYSRYIYAWTDYPNIILPEGVTEWHFEIL